MIINKANLAAIFITLKTTFNKAFESAPSTWQKIAMKVTSTTGQNDYSWLSRFPKMRKWVSEKHIKSLEAFQYTLVNDDFEATVEVDRNDIDDDNIGIYGPMAQEAGFSSKQLPDELISELVNGAFVNKCFDGQYFCDTDHPVGDGGGGVTSVSNKSAAVLDISTVAAAKASFGAARTAMKKFKDNEGRPLNLRPNILLVGATLEDDANALMTAERLEDGRVNPYKNSCEVVVDTRIESDTAWFVLDTTRPVKPFIYQERKAPVFVQQIDPQADNVFLRKKFLFGAEARAASGYSFWQLCFGSTGTA